MYHGLENTMDTVEEGKGLLEKATCSQDSWINRFDGGRYRMRNYDTSKDDRKYSSNDIIFKAQKKHVSESYFVFSDNFHVLGLGLRVQIYYIYLVNNNQWNVVLGCKKSSLYACSVLYFALARVLVFRIIIHLTVDI